MHEETHDSPDELEDNDSVTRSRSSTVKKDEKPGRVSKIISKLRPRPLQRIISAAREAGRDFGTSLSGELRGAVSEELWRYNPKVPVDRRDWNPMPAMPHLPGYVIHTLSMAPRGHKLDRMVQAPKRLDGLIELYSQGAPNWSYQECHVLGLWLSGWHIEQGVGIQLDDLRIGGSPGMFYQEDGYELRAFSGQDWSTHPSLRAFPRMRLPNEAMITCRKIQGGHDAVAAFRLSLLIAVRAPVQDDALGRGTQVPEGPGLLDSLDLGIAGITGSHGMPCLPVDSSAFVSHVSPDAPDIKALELQKAVKVAAVHHAGLQKAYWQWQQLVLRYLESGQPTWMLRDLMLAHASLLHHLRLSLGDSAAIELLDKLDDKVITKIIGKDA